MSSGSVQNIAFLLFRILNHTDGPSGALIIFVQLKITDKSGGSRFKLTTPYFAVVITLSGSCGGKTACIVFFCFCVEAFTLSINEQSRGVILIYPRGNKISQAGTAWYPLQDALPFNTNKSISEIWCSDNNLNFWVDLFLKRVIKTFFIILISDLIDLLLHYTSFYTRGTYSLFLFSSYLSFLP